MTRLIVKKIPAEGPSARGAQGCAVGLQHGRQERDGRSLRWTGGVGVVREAGSGREEAGGWENSPAACSHRSTGSDRETEHGASHREAFFGAAYNAPPHNVSHDTLGSSPAAWGGGAAAAGSRRKRLLAVSSSERNVHAEEGCVAEGGGGGRWEGCGAKEMQNAVWDEVAGREKGYNSADEYEDAEKKKNGEEQDEDGLLKDKRFEEDLWKERGLLIRKCKEDGNCLFRAISDQLYGDQEMHDDVRERCLNYIAQEKDHFGPFITEEFDEYVQRKRRDKVFGNNLEMQAIAEMYNRPIEVFSYSTDPMVILQEESKHPPIRLSYHRGNHYNSIINPKEHCVGLGLGLPSAENEVDDSAAVTEVILGQTVRESEELDLEEALLQSTLQASMVDYEDYERETQLQFEQMCLEQSLRNTGQYSSAGAAAGPR